MGIYKGDMIANRQKITMLDKSCLAYFSSFIQAVESATPPEKYEASDSTVCVVIKKKLIQLEKINQPFLDFRCNLQPH